VFFWEVEIENKLERWRKSWKGKNKRVKPPVGKERKGPLSGNEGLWRHQGAEGGIAGAEQEGRGKPGIKTVERLLETPALGGSLQGVCQGKRRPTPEGKLGENSTVNGGGKRRLRPEKKVSERGGVACISHGRTGPEGGQKKRGSYQKGPPGHFVAQF